MKERTRLTTKLKSRRAGLPARVSRVDLITTQGRWWVDRHGNWHDIAKIDRDYRRALIAYLERKAERLFLINLLLTPHLSYSGEELDRDFDTGPRDWIREQPLYRALKALG